MTTPTKEQIEENALRCRLVLDQYRDAKNQIGQADEQGRYWLSQQMHELRQKVRDHADFLIRALAHISNDIWRAAYKALIGIFNVVRPPNIQSWRDHLAKVLS